jgi:hypothetical protein
LVEERVETHPYAINGELMGKRWFEVAKEDLIVADSESYVFNSAAQLAKGHDHQALAVTKSGQIVAPVIAF